MPEPHGEDALGWSSFFELMHDAGLLEPRPREPRPTAVVHEEPPPRLAVVSVNGATVPFNALP